jgi:hypothetical protein
MEINYKKRDRRGTKKEQILYKFIAIEGRKEWMGWTYMGKVDLAVLSS